MERENDSSEQLELLNKEAEIEKLKMEGFHRAALYLENPELVDGLTLNDILVLNDHLKRGRHDREKSINGRLIKPEQIPSITVATINRIREVLPNPDQSLSLEDAFLIEDIYRRSCFSGQERLVYASIACGLFHAAYFFSPFPADREPYFVYATPAALIREVLSKEQENPENFAWAETIMKKIINYINTEFAREYIYYSILYPRSDAWYQTKNLNKQEKQRLAKFAGINLKGYSGAIHASGGRQGRYPGRAFCSSLEQALDPFIRPIMGSHMEGLKDFHLLARMKQTPYAEKLAETFRALARDNPPHNTDILLLKELNLGAQDFK